MPQCASCGRAVADTSRACDSCGAAVEAAESFATRTVAASQPRTPAPGRTTSARWSHARSQGRFAPGELLGGRYRIVAMLGKGGMGEVYRADDLVLDQPVALKFLPEAVSHNEQALERFRNEVRTARQVSHPNVCRVYDLGEMEGLYFLSMEYVDGEDLGSLLRRIGRLPADKALEIARKLCAGLAAAHEKGVLHRDLKPANVMLDGRGQVLLTDFGLAGLAGEIEGAEVRNGTPAYMAPEQLSGQEVTVRSDIYALGLVLYEIFSGKLPFESETLAGLMRAQRESAPPSLTTLVRDLDPAIERVILRCLDPKPSLRPVSALSVAAALPGGDPLAAALAAGETPSPEMVAAAGEGEGLAPRIAVALLIFILLAVPITYGMRTRSSALLMLAPEYGPEVMTLKAREVAQKLGGERRPADEWSRFDWQAGLFDWLRQSASSIDWRKTVPAYPQALTYEYRSHVAPMTGLMLHDDLLTPGVVYWEDPPFEASGMTRLRLDSDGRLLEFERMPAQLLAAATEVQPPDPAVLFEAAGIDMAKWQPAEPLWTSLAASDTRLAWTTESPRRRRVEAAFLRGQPVFFRIVEPWDKPGRMPNAGGSQANSIAFAALSAVLVVIIFSAALLAIANFRRQRGDRRGALRLAIFMGCVQMLLWTTRAHLLLSIGTYGAFLVALATASFYAVVMWTVYMALEPYVRRRWPQVLISWSTLLLGRARDAIVGRDILIGCSAGTLIALIDRAADAWTRRAGGWAPDQDLLGPLMGLRGTLALVASAVPHAVRETLFFFFLIFLLRVALRNQWAAGAAFALLFASLNLATANHPVFSAIVSFLVLLGLAWLVLRWGLLAMASAQLFANVANIPAASPSSWYVGQSVFGLLLAGALAIWAFHISLGGRKLWKEAFFG